MYAEEILQPQLKAFPKVLLVVEIWLVLSHFAFFQQGGVGFAQCQETLDGHSTRCVGGIVGLYSEQVLEDRG